MAWYGGRLAHEALYLEYLDPRGRAAGPMLRLTDATRDAFEPSLQDLQGDALLAWYEQESAPSGPPRQWALIARFDREGRRLWQRRLSAEDARGRIPVVRVDAGTIHAAWVEEQGDESPRLKVAQLDASGGWLRSPRDVTAVGRSTWNLNAAIGAEGTFHVVFDARSDSAAAELHWVRVREGQVFETRASREDGLASAYPDIAVAAGRYALTWFDLRDGNAEVYLRCGSLDAVGAPEPVPHRDDAADIRVTRTPAQSTGAYLTWHAGRIELAWTEGEGARQSLWRQRFDRDCHPLGTARRIESNGAGIPSWSSSPLGVLLAWTRQRGAFSRPGTPPAQQPASVVKVELRPSRLVSPSAAVR